MIRELFLLTALNFVTPGFSQPNRTLQGNNTSLSNPDWKNAKSVYDFNFVNIDGQVESMDKYRGHVLIVVNVASF
jgi:hypothetical protein